MQRRTCPRRAACVAGRRRRYRLSLSSSDEALGLQLDGVDHALRHVHDEAAAAAVEAGLAVAPASFSLQSIIHLRQATGHPVLLSEDGKILGVCGETEIIRALAGGRLASADHKPLPPGVMHDEGSSRSGSEFPGVVLVGATGDLSKRKLCPGCCTIERGIDCRLQDHRRLAR